MSMPACWTCRLRRKKCDRAQPTCTSCAHLGIDCHYSNMRPGWMDGGQRQSDMAKAVSAQVKQGAAGSREKEFAVQVFPLNHNSSGRASAGTRASPSPHSNSASTSSATNSAKPVHASSQDETDDYLLALYLDTVFPFLFPWYQPTSLSGGRSWLLSILKSQQAICHAAISISAYYFALSLAKDARHTIRTPCEQHVWDTMAMHMNCSMQMIRQDMDDSRQGFLRQTKVDIFHKAHLLEAIGQLLIFETTMAKGADWNMHLTAAVVLFNDIFENHGVENGQYRLELVLRAMEQERPMFEGIELGFTVWNADQASFQFFAAFLIFADIISSVVLRIPPRLRHYYSSLIVDNHPNTYCQDDQSIMLRMEDYIGCPGWVLVVLGEISAFESWKNSARHNEGDRVTGELRSQRERLENRLRDGLVGLSDTKANETQDHSRGLVAKAWIHATMIYLTVVVEGWQQPSQPMILQHVRCVLEVLDALPSQLSPRRIMWPFCVAGCFAPVEQEQVFRDAVSAMGHFQAFGTAKEALQLMERTWNLRDEINQDSWGLSDCFEAEGVHFLVI